MRDLPDVADQIARSTQQVGGALSGGVRRRSGDGPVGVLPVGRRDPVRQLAQDSAVPAENRAGRQRQLAPPRDVGEVAESTDHRDAGTLFGIGESMRHDGHFDIEQRSANGRAEQGLIALVIRVRHQRDAGSQQLRTSGFDLDGFAVGPVKGDAVVGTRALPILELGLGDGRPERHVPKGRSFGLIGLAADQVAQEGTLRCRPRIRVNRLVGHRPVDRDPEAAPELLENDLVLGGEAFAEFDEVSSADRELILGRLRRWFEIGVVGQRRIAADAVVILDPALGRQAVVVPAHRVEDLEAVHPLEASDQVSVRVGKDVSDVERTADRRRWRVDRVNLLARCGPVEPVDPVFLPYLGPANLESLNTGGFGDAGAAAGLGHGRHPMEAAYTHRPWPMLPVQPDPPFPTRSVSLLPRPNYWPGSRSRSLPRRSTG